MQGFMIFDDGKPIGMARLLGDYAMAYLIKDVVGLLEYQHRGAGTLLMLRWDMSSVFKSSHMPRGFSGKRNGTLRI
nr:GNAT family N-acetyltransferase [Bifidobacterium dentium]